MKQLVTSALVLLSLTTLANAAEAHCRRPVGGSENSVGTDLPSEEERRALDAFDQSYEVLGQRDLLLAHGYCADDLGVQATLVSRTCEESDDVCDTVIRLSQSFESDIGSVRSIIAVFHYSGQFQWSQLSVEELDLEGLGSLRTLDDQESAVLMDAMGAAGVTNPSRVVGIQTLFAGRLSCSHAVIPRPVARCHFEVGGDTFEVSRAPSQALEDILADLGAYTRPILIGAVNTTAALVTCSQVVVPGAVPSCSLVVED